MNNLVHSLKFDLSCRDEQQAFTLRRAISEELQALVTELIDTVCSRHIPGNEVIRIDRLDLDLGNLQSATLDEQFARQFREQFETRLLEQLQRNAAPGGQGSAMDAVLQVFIHFMQTGQLPWWTAPAEQDLDAICRDLLVRMPDAVLAFFRQHSSNHRLWRRVVKQLDQNFWQFLFNRIPVLNRAQSALPGVITAIRQALIVQALPSAQQTTGPQLARLVSDQPVGGGGTPVTVPTGNGLIDQLLMALEQYNQNASLHLLERAPELFAAAAQNRVNDALAAMILDMICPPAVAENEQLRAAVKNNLHLQPDVQQVPSQDAGQTEIVPVLPEGPVMPERMIVHDAGLVLLGPYLKPLFTTLGYWSEAAWTSPEAHEKAVCLLHVIATGNAVCKEYDLVLCKLLCGLPVAEPVYTAYTFTEAELKETEALLEAVIAHWQALKNTSVAGFRTAFLQREAALFAKEQDWQLVVERKTLDVLLESIPWGYGTLALSWNTYLIFTEW